MARGISLADWIRRRGGVVHTSDARAAGFSKFDMASAVSLGLLVRVRRSWLMTPDADHRRAAAASVSGRVTCVSEAALLGLWAPQHEGVHVAVAPTGSRFDASGLVVHWARGPVPVSRTAIDDPIINVLFHSARCLPRSDALAIWESAIRKKKVSADVLSEVDWRSSRARVLADVASLLSDSGLETVFVDAFRNYGLSMRQQVRIDGHPVDILIGDRLVIQIDGFEHHRAGDRRRDLRADARLVLRGYTVLRFDFQQTLFQWDYVEQVVTSAIAQGLHLRRRG